MLFHPSMHRFARGTKKPAQDLFLTPRPCVSACNRIPFIQENRCAMHTLQNLRSLAFICGCISFVSPACARASLRVLRGYDNQQERWAEPTLPLTPRPYPFSSTESRLALGLLW